MHKEYKQYDKPEIVVYGTVEDLTQQYGNTYLDVPQGTSCIGNSVTGS